MNAIIEKDVDFSASLHFDNVYFTTKYSCKLTIEVFTESTFDQTVALERLLFFINNVFAHSLFIKYTEEEQIKKYVDAGINVCEMPEEPWDQIVGMVLLQKLNSIMEGKLRVLFMKIGSEMSDGILYHLSDEIAESAELLKGPHWWNSIGIQIMSDKPDSKVVKLYNDDKDWENFDLSWEKSS